MNCVNAKPCSLIKKLLFYSDIIQTNKFLNEIKNMIEVIPFRGLLYNLDITGPLDKLIAPPYDVIFLGPAAGTIRKKHPNNVVRLILGKEFNSDTDAGQSLQPIRTGFFKIG
ncbi:MAG: hypothetical protein CM1200mP16_00350 [Nitrospina sp.]|nr:MAG: hypothetical protein CM1200mP16_00350 [Nitrospina sp.]